MTLTTHGFCPRCQKRVELNPMVAGEHLVDVCYRCDNAMIYESREQWVEDERETYERIRDCDHQFGYEDSRVPDDQCAYCGIHESMSAEDAIHDDIDISDLQEDQ